jgi:hypothetical protein
MLFYVRRHTGADCSFEWYVLNGHTRRRASTSVPTRAAAAAEREKLQARLDLAKAKALRRTPRGAPKDNARPPAESGRVIPRWGKVRSWKGDALPELPLAHHAVIAVDHDDPHRRSQLCAGATGVMVERPTGFLRANEPAYIFVLAVIVIHPHAKLLTHAAS